ncbi:unnamed protein product [Cylindrotheca closterium]|uniref:Uncharacterized protein n=1 Tax=Cylindrotheca closterium TaxID=2856 RepID=A0AAD2FQ83_9STRA|nr:unnamed protein product [Cylindrotheca closterium]
MDKEELRKQATRILRVTEQRVHKQSFVAFFLGFLISHLLSVGNFSVAKDNSAHLVVVSGESKSAESKSVNTKSVETESIEKASGLNALEHSDKHNTFVYHGKKSTTDTFTPFHRYMSELGSPSVHNFTVLPQQNSWLHYFEAYHNHMARFRGKGNVVFMEIGVQSGGKIPILRKYFGPGLTYIGLDINPSTKMFETTESDDFTVHIEIGDSGDPKFLDKIKAKYPHVDIFLDDGGHTMKQQMVAMEHMLPHVQPEGVYMCEDLGTSWKPNFGGIKFGSVGKDNKWVATTMVGLVHQSLDWFMAPANAGAGKGNTVLQDVKTIPDDRFDLSPESPSNRWWKTIPNQVKHIHYYSQIVVYEKGVTYQGAGWKTIGTRIPYKDSGTRERVDWKSIIGRLDGIFGEGLL